MSRLRTIQAARIRLTTKKSAELCFIFTFLYLSVSVNVFAAPPSGGSILSEEKQRKEQKAIENMQPNPPAESVETSHEFKSPSSLKVFIKKIEFSGYDSTVSLEELNKISAPYLRKEAVFADLERLVREITKYLRQRSSLLLSRAYLPEQDITDGRIKIVIVPGKLDGKIEVFTTKPSRINKHLLENIAANAIPEEEAIKSKSLERALLLMSELPGISSKAYLDKGKSPGTTKVFIEAKEDNQLSGVVYGDNFGDNSTGVFRRVAQVSFNDSLHWGDLLQVTYINSDYLNQGVAHLSFPIGSQGLFADLSGNGLSYKLRGKFKDLDGDGDAVTGSAGLRYPLILTRKANLWLGTGYDYYYLNDRLSGTSYSLRNISAGNVTVRGNLYDNILGGGLNYFLTSLSGGNVNIDAGRDLDDAGAHTNGGYFRAAYLAARLQQVTKNTSLLFSTRGQASSCNLDASQKIILGGPTGVRAYPVGEAASDEGNIMTFETRYELPFMPAWLKTQLVGFYDAGYAVLHKNTWRNSVTSATGDNQYWIQGAGPGINIGKQGLYRLQLSYAFKIGDNPGRDTSGNDANNENNNGQLWVQGIFWF